MTAPTYRFHSRRGIENDDNQPDRYAAYDLGDQPCSSFRPNPDDDREHQCPKCGGWRRFCNICCLDHHLAGWDFCNDEPVAAADDLNDFATMLSPTPQDRRALALIALRTARKECQNLPGSAAIAVFIDNAIMHLEAAR